MLKIDIIYPSKSKFIGVLYYILRPSPKYGLCQLTLPCNCLFCDQPMFLTSASKSVVICSVKLKLIIYKVALLFAGQFSK